MSLDRETLHHLDCLLARSRELGAPSSTLANLHRILELAGVDLASAGQLEASTTREAAIRYGAAIVHALERLEPLHARTAVWLADWPPDTIDRVIALVRGECPLVAIPCGPTTMTFDQAEDAAREDGEECEYCDGDGEDEAGDACPECGGRGFHA